MNFNDLEKIITKTGIVSLAALGVIGIVASIFGAAGVDMDLFVGTVVEDIFFLILFVLGILAGFCLPASLLINLSCIAVSLRRRSNEVK